MFPDSPIADYKLKTKLSSSDKPHVKITLTYVHLGHNLTELMIWDIFSLLNLKWIYFNGMKFS